MEVERSRQRDNVLMVYCVVPEADCKWGWRKEGEGVGVEGRFVELSIGRGHRTWDQFPP